MEEGAVFDAGEAHLAVEYVCRSFGTPGFPAGQAFGFEIGGASEGVGGADCPVAVLVSVTFEAEAFVGVEADDGREVREAGDESGFEVPGVGDDEQVGGEGIESAADEMAEGVVVGEVLWNFEAFELDAELFGGELDSAAGKRVGNAGDDHSRFVVLGEEAGEFEGVDSRAAFGRPVEEQIEDDDSWHVWISDRIASVGWHRSHGGSFIGGRGGVKRGSKNLRGRDASGHAGVDRMEGMFGRSELRSWQRRGVLPLVLAALLSGCQTALEEVIEPAGEPVPMVPSELRRETYSFGAPTGATLVVDTTADTISNDGRTSLREAVALAAADAEPNAIVFDRAIFRVDRMTTIVLGESILVGGAGDAIIGGESEVVIDGGGIRGRNIAIVVLRAAGVRVSGLTIGNVAGAAVLIDVGQSSSEVIGVDRCRLVNCSVAGVFVNGALDVPLVVSGTTFEDIGGEAIDYPLSVRPIAPRVGEISGNLVRGFAEPGARVEFFLDDAHLARSFLGATEAGGDGSFVIDLGRAPTGQRINATSTSVGGVTSSLRTVGGSPDGDFAAALLTGTGPMSEDEGAVDESVELLRWAIGTHLVIHLGETLGGLFELALGDFAERIGSLTGGQVTAELRVGELGAVADGDRVVEFLYVASSSTELGGTEGRTFLSLVGGELVRARVVVNRDSREPGVGVHELGHLLGLRHLCVNGQTMMDTSSCSRAGVVITVHPEGASYFDALALKALYGPGVVPGDTLFDLRALGLVR